MSNFTNNKLDRITSKLFQEVPEHYRTLESTDKWPESKSFLPQRQRIDNSRKSFMKVQIRK